MKSKLDRWDAWSPVQAAGWLNSAGARWAVAGGWALELFVGESWRVHADLEIVVDRASFDTVRDALPPLEWFGAGDGELCPLELAGEMFEQRWQTWGRDPGTGCWRIDVMRERWDSEEWVYRRDQTIRRSLAEAIASTDERIPYLAPEIVLLFMAKHFRAKDEEDFMHVLPHLSCDQRTPGSPPYVPTEHTEGREARVSLCPNDTNGCDRPAHLLCAEGTTRGFAAGGPGQGDGWTRWAICRSFLSSVSSAESVMIAVASDIASGSRSD